VRSELVRVAAWRAARSGVTGELVHPGTGRPAPAAEVATALLDHVGPALADAGDGDRVSAGVAEILRRGTGADLQRRVLAETGEAAAVVRAAVEQTVRPPQDAAQAGHGRAS
jgi:carboxylate-amine ligase